MSNAPEVMSPYFHNSQRDDMPRIISPCPRLRPDLYGERMFGFEKEMLSAISQMQKDIAEIKGYIQSKEVENVLPPAQPQRMHGKWIWVDATKSLICSKCKQESPMRSDFCPNCGEDMREE